MFWENLATTVKGITNAFSSLPNIVRSGQIDELVNIDKQTRTMVSAFLRYDINNYELIFDKLKLIYNSRSYDEVYTHIVESNNLLKNAYNSYVSIIIDSIKSIFGANTEESLKSIIDGWVLKFDVKIKSISNINTFEKKLLDFFVSDRVSFNDSDTANNIAKALTNLSIADWQSDLTDQVNNTLTVLKNKIETIQENRNVAFDSMIELSRFGKMAKRNVTAALDEFADSISVEEKINILVKLIEELKQ